MSTSPAPAISPEGLAIAATVKTEAQLRAAPPEVQKYLSSPVKQTHENTITMVSTPTRADIDHANAITTASSRRAQAGAQVHNAILATSISGQAPSPGCYSWSDFYATYNAFGGLLQEWGPHFDNWCWVFNLYGYWVIYSNPTAYPYETAGWGWGSCGTQNWYAQWTYQPFQWGAGAQFQFSYGPGCAFTTAKYAWGRINGNGSYQGSST
jgi:hypothetical protein